MTNQAIAKEIKEVNVKGILVECVQTEEGKIWVILSSLCNGLGIRTDKQVERIKRDEDLLLKGYSKMGVPSNGGIQEMGVIELEFLPFFLTGIKSSMCKEEIRDNIKEFKLKAKDILAEAFLGKNNEKKEEFFDGLGLKMDIKDIVEKAIQEVVTPLNAKIQSLQSDFSMFRKEHEQQNEQLYFLVKRFSIYENEDCNYTRLVNDFNAKVYKSNNSTNIHYRFWEGVSNWLSLDFTKLLAEKNKKKFLKDNIGMNVLNYFVDNVILDKIVLNENNHWINLNGFNGDPFNIEKNKILRYWTNEEHQTKCCYCGKEIINPQENVNFNFEHYIAKTDKNTSNLIGNLGLACCDCNEKKNSTDYKTFRTDVKTNDNLIKRMDRWIDRYKINR